MMSCRQMVQKTPGMPEEDATVTLYVSRFNQLEHSSKCFASIGSFQHWPIGQRSREAAYGNFLSIILLPP